MSEFSKVHRPKPGETEDDLLQEMKQFETGKASISSQNIVRLSKNDDKQKMSKFAAGRTNLKRQHEREEQQKSSINFILKSVVEEKVSDFPTEIHFEPKFKGEEAFPAVTKVDTNVFENRDNTQPGKRQSIFAQQMAASLTQPASMSDETSPASTSKRTSRPTPRFDRDFGSESLLLKSSSVIPPDERSSIHLGNVNILNSKTDEQLMQDRENLMKELNPSIVNFLRKKRLEAEKSEARNPEPMAVNEDDDQPRVVAAQDKASEVNQMGEAMIVDEKSDSKIEIPTKVGDVNLNELRKFTHMETVEPEKMEWMRDLDQKKDEAPPEEFSARFDFGGSLLPFNSEDISVKAGLHHHGEEPERPGYTLDELLTLARSVIPQQKTIALETLAKVIENYKKGRFDSCFRPETNLLSQLIQADLVTLLRTGVDENNSAVIIEATVKCFAELVDNQVEEIGLDSQLFNSVFPGYVQPSLQVKLSTEKDFQKEAPELKDFQIVQADLILGLFRMDLLDRLAYILDILRPNSQTLVVNILRILVRMSRHSLGAAAKIIQHKTLLPIIVSHFLPLVSPLSCSSDKIYGTPVHHALKILRVLMSWSRSFTSEILDKFAVGKKILCYIAIEPSNDSPHLQETLRLTIEACRVWIICLRFGLETERFLEFYPIIINHVKFLNTNVSMVEVKPGTKFNYHHATALLEVISAAICCVPSSMESYAVVEKRAIRGQPLDWTHLLGVVDMIQFCLKKWIHESCSSNDSLQPFCIGLLASTISMFATFIERFPAADNFEAVSFLERLEDLFPFVINRVLKSNLALDLMKSVVSHSVLSRIDLLEGRRRDPENLPSLGSVEYTGDVVAGLLETSPFTFFNALFGFIRSSIKIHTSLDTSEVVSFMMSQPMMTYLNAIVDVGFKKSSSNWFIRQEIHFLRLILEINDQIKGLEKKVIWKLAGILVSHYQIGDEFYIRKILKGIVFNPEYLDPTDSMIWQMKNTEISKDSTKMMTMEEALPQILDLYSDLILGTNAALEKSIVINNKLCYSVSSLTINSNGETCLPTDWQYLPLLTVLNRRMLPSSSGGVNDIAKSEEDEIRAVQLCLIWVYIMTVTTKLEQKMSPASARLRLTRLATVFLATPDLFLDPMIHKLTEMCLFDIMATVRSVKFDETIPGIESFFDFYTQLIEQYQAVSYGDNLFSTFVLLPLTNTNPWKYKATLWIDHPEALRNITLRSDQLPNTLKLSSFIEKSDAANLDVQRAYVKALVTDSIVQSRNPLLFDIAVANARQAISNDEKFKEEILPQLKALNKLKLIEKITQD